MNFWDFLWLMFWCFIFVQYIIVLFQVIKDLFRDDSMNGWVKALWIVFLLVMPFLSLLIYLISRGRSMSERQVAEMQGARAATDDYIRSVAAGHTAADDITSAKQLLDSGVIDQTEFNRLKEKALA